MKTLKILATTLIVIAMANRGYTGEKRINAERIKNEIIRTVLENSPWSKNDLEVDNITINDDRAEYEKADSFRVESPSGTKNLGKVALSIKLFSGGKELKTIWASAMVRAYKSAVVALDGLKINARIAAEDVKLARVDVNEAQNSFSSMEDVVGMTVKRPVSPGSVIRKDYIKPDVLVKRGSRVAIMIQNKGFMVKSAGVAAEDGYPGDMIKARTKAGTEIMGKVTGREELTLAF